MNQQRATRLFSRLLLALAVLFVPLASMPMSAQAAGSDGTLTGHIVFQTASGGAIYVVNANGTGLRQLTTGLDPAWSPDGKQVAFTRFGGVAPGLYLINRDSSNERLIFRGNEVRYPTWSPNGSQIAFNKLTDRIPELLYFPGRPPIPTGRLIDVRTMGVVNVADGSYVDLPSEQRSSSPSWLPDGKTVVFRGDNGLSQTNLQGPTQALNKDARIDSPSVSPLGSRVLMMSRIHQEWDIVATNPDGQGQVELTQFDPLADVKIDNVAPAWSPAGQSVVFLSNRDGSWQPYIMDADGSNLRLLFPNGLPGIEFTYNYAAERVFSWTAF